MSFAFGVTISFARVGSSFNFLFSPIAATRYGVVWALSIGTVLCAISLLSAMLLYALDQYAVKVGLMEPDSVDLANDASQSEEGAAEDLNNNDGIKFSNLLQLSSSFWYLCGICLFSYNAVSPFVGIARNFFQVKYGYSGTVASQTISSYQMTSAIFSPFVGFLVDSMGRNTYTLIMVSVIFALIHLLFICTDVMAVVLMVVMGFFFSFLAAALWPAVPLVVPSTAVGLSFGVMTSLQNIGLAVFPMLAGAVLDAHTTRGNSVPSDGEDVLPSLEGFNLTLLLFLASALLSAGFSTGLLIRDLHHGRILTMSGSERHEVEGIVVTIEEGPEEQRQSLLDYPEDEEDGDDAD